MISMDGILFFFGMFFLSLENVIPKFISDLGGRNSVISLVAAAGNLGVYLPAILVANYIQRLKRKKKYIIAIGAVQRVFWLFAAVVSLFYAEKYPKAVIVTVLSAILLSSIAGGINIPAFYYYTAKTIPSNLRGRLFGLRNMGSYLLGLGAGLLIRRIIDVFNFPGNYTILLFIGSGLIFSTLIPLSIVREPDARHVSQHEPPGVIFRKVKSIFLANGQLRMFILGRIFYMLSLVCLAYFSPYIIGKFKVSNSELGTFAVITAVTYIIANPFIGILADRHGHRILFIIGSVATIAASVIALLPLPYFISLTVFVAAAVAMSIRIVSEFTMILDYCRESEIPLYFGIVGIFVGAASVLLIFTGIIADILGTEAVFIISMLFSGLALYMFIFRIKEPRKNTAKVKEDEIFPDIILPDR